MELLFVCLAAHDSEFRRWPDGVDRRICQTFAASPAEPGELPLGFRGANNCERTAICFFPEYCLWVKPGNSISYHELGFSLRRQPAHQGRACSLFGNAEILADDYAKLPTTGIEV